MADTIAQFLAKINKTTAAMPTLERRTVEVAALAVKTSVLAAMQTAGVDNGRLKGVGKKGAKVGVRYDIQGRENSALVRATGPLHLLERDTKPHRMPRERKTARAKKRLVVIPDVGVRAYAQHPGTKGKHPWEKGVAAAIPIQEKAQGVALHQMMAKVWQ